MQQRKRKGPEAVCLAKLRDRVRRDQQQLGCSR